MLAFYCGFPSACQCLVKRGHWNLTRHPESTSSAARSNCCSNSAQAFVISIVPARYTEWRDLMGEMVQFKRPDGKTCPGYLGSPRAGAGAHRFVCIQEYWGLNDQIKKTADRLAAAAWYNPTLARFRGSCTFLSEVRRSIRTSGGFAANCARGGKKGRSWQRTTADSCSWLLP
jgi:hypothetical protein